MNIRQLFPFLLLALLIAQIPQRALADRRERTRQCIQHVWQSGGKANIEGFADFRETMNQNRNSISQWHQEGMANIRALGLDPVLEGPTSDRDYARRGLSFPSNGQGPAATVLSEGEAEGIFEYIKFYDYIDFTYQYDGCYARTYEINSLLKRLGITSLKALIHPPGGKKIPVSFADGSGVNWNGHVVPVILVKTVHSIQKMVIDPLFFDGPVSIQAWEARVLLGASHKVSGLDSVSPEWRANIYGPDDLGYIVSLWGKINAQSLQNMMDQWLYCIQP